MLRYSVNVSIKYYTFMTSCVLRSFNQMSDSSIKQFALLNGEPHLPDGECSPILITALHFAKCAPAFLYSLHRSSKPSIPCVTVSTAVPGSATTPLSTFIPVKNVV